MNTFDSRASLRVGSKQFDYFRIPSLDQHGFTTARLPFSLRILLENLLRREDGVTATEGMIRKVASWTSKTASVDEISFMPSRVLMQDFTGVPAVVDLAAMRDAMTALGGDPKKINPLQPAELVIDHSVSVDEFGTPQAFDLNAALEFERNQERYSFLRWGQKALKNFAIVPPDTGIVHQINIEYLAPVVFVLEQAGKEIASIGESGTRQQTPLRPPALAYPDTVVGTDSHTPMVNGVGVLGWGVGGIEAEANMLGEASPLLIPQVVGVRFTGKMREGSTATDLVLTVVEALRKKGVVGKFVEYFGPSLGALTVADRTTLSNMSPEYGATVGYFPVDEETLRYLKLTGRSEEKIALVEAYYKAQGLFYVADAPEPEYTDVLHIDLATIEPSISGPRRPQDRVELGQASASFDKTLASLLKPNAKVTTRPAGRLDRKSKDYAKVVQNGTVVIAAITSCTNTSNPAVMVAAGLVAKKAVEKGLKRPAWVKSSLAPGSKVVTEYLAASGLTPYLDQLGFNLVGYGCTTCIGNSGPLPKEVGDVVAANDLVVASVLSGNRNFEGRINSEVRANYLMSPPLVVAFGLAGEMIDMYHEPIGEGTNGPVYLKDLWPTQKEVDEVVERSITSKMFRESYASVLEGDSRWQGLKFPLGDTYAWDAKSTYIQSPPYFEGMTREPKPVTPVKGARVLAWLGHSVTTDHISPAGSIRSDSPAGKYLMEHGVKPVDFNSYGSRRGNHQVMMRGTFANTRIRNKLVPQIEGGYTKVIPGGKEMSIYDAAMEYHKQGVPVIILAGKEYGSGSSRDWAAKGPLLLGVRAVIAESFERIHRSNLLGMGLLPLQLPEGQTAETLGLTGEESYEILGVDAVLKNFAPGKTVEVKATAADGSVKTFKTTLRIDTPQEGLYYQHGGVLQYVLRQLLK